MGHARETYVGADEHLLEIIGLGEGFQAHVEMIFAVEHIPQLAKKGIARFHFFERVKQLGDLRDQRTIRCAARFVRRQHILGGVQPRLGFFPPGFACFQIVQRAIVLQPLRKILVQRRRSRQRF